MGYFSFVAVLLGTTARVIVDPHAERLNQHDGALIFWLVSLMSESHDVDEGAMVSR